MVDKPHLEAVPEVAEDVINDTPEEPGYVGTLDDNERKAIQSLWASSNQLVNRVGQLEVQKQRLLRQILGMEDQVNAVVARATQRFGVEGGAWTLTSDGKVFRAEGR